MEFSQLASYLFHSQTQIHMFHLQTNSYAEHKAFQKYYESIDGLMDNLIESYQGKYGVITSYASFTLHSYQGIEQAIAYFDTLCSYINQLFNSIEDTFLQNQLDEITTLIKSTVYKLKYLK